MATDFGLVVKAAEGHTDIFAVHGFGNALAEGGLASARRANKAEDGTLHVVLETEDGDVFDNALLDLLHAVVVAVQDFAGMGSAEVVLAVDIPRHVEEELGIIEFDGIVRGLRGGAAELFDTVIKGVLGFLAPLFLLRTCHQALYILVG